jgi:hypothetical protein
MTWDPFEQAQSHLGCTRTAMVAVQAVGGSSPLAHPDRRQRRLIVFVLTET